MIRQATVNDVDDIIKLIQKRIDWMNHQHLKQWNTTNYLEVYDREYFIKNIDSFIVDEDNQKIIGAICLYTHDSRWKDHKECFYIHHLVSDPDNHGIGKKLMLEAEHLSKDKGYDCIRLDSAKSNEKLKDFYEFLGYQPMYEFKEGEYIGVTREKKL